MKTTIICFSPTGGVEKVAQLIANELKIAAPYDYTTRGYEVSFSSDDLVFFCFPVYGGRIPTPMYDRMNYVHGNGAKAVLVAVYGNRAVEDALLEMSDLCLNRGFKVVGGAEMIAPHSIDKRFGAGRPDASDIADHSGLVGMELRLCRSAFIIGRVIKQSKRQKHKGERRLTQPHFTRRGKSRTEHRRNNGNGGQPVKGQYVICREYRRAKGSRRRRKLPHCRLHSKIPRRQNVSAVFRIISSYR